MRTAPTYSGLERSSETTIHPDCFIAHIVKVDIFVIGVACVRFVALSEVRRHSSGWFDPRVAFASDAYESHRELLPPCLQIGILKSWLMEMSVRLVFP